MKQKLSFYVTIKGITMRLKNASLRTISHVAEQLEDLEDSSNLDISVTSVVRHYDYVTDDAEVFINRVKKAVEYQTAHKKDLLLIDQVIAAIREDFPDFYIRRNSNAKITVQDTPNPLKKFRVFAGLFDEIVLHVEPSNSQPIMIKFDTIDELIRHIHAMEYFGL